MLKHCPSTVLSSRRTLVTLLMEFLDLRLLPEVKMTAKCWFQPSMKKELSTKAFSLSIWQTSAQEFPSLTLEHPTKQSPEARPQYGFELRTNSGPRASQACSSLTLPRVCTERRQSGQRQAQAQRISEVQNQRFSLLRRKSDMFLMMTIKRMIVE